MLPLLGGGCISYISLAVVKHCVPRNYRRNSSLEFMVPESWSLKGWNRGTDVRNWMLRTGVECSYLNMKAKSREKQLHMAIAFKVFKPASSSSKKDIHPQRQLGIKYSNICAMRDILIQITWFSGRGDSGVTQ